MPLENNPDGIEDLDPNSPAGNEPVSDGDGHLRNIKAAVQGSFPNIAGPNNIGAPLTVGKPLGSGHAVRFQDVSFLQEAVITYGTIDESGAKIFPLSSLGNGDTVTAVREAAPGEFTLIFGIAASSLNAQVLMCTLGGNGRPNSDDEGLTVQAWPESTTQWRVLITKGGLAQAWNDFMFCRVAWAPGAVSPAAAPDDEGENEDGD